MAKLVDGYEVVIGLEIHCQLATQSKLFSAAPTTFGAEPNTQASLVDLAMPGTLPVLNREAVDKAIRFGLGIDAEIGRASVFARKNYFYPDLPKGYQISQFELPIVGKGYIDIVFEEEKGKPQTKRIGVTRAHLEEDAGKSLHEDFAGQTGIDLNRAGTPLLEIVSEPDMRSSAEAVAYVRQIHSLVRWLGISDGNMAEGSFRCDCNVSIRKPGAPFGTRCELKNINSFRFIERAIEAEIERQIDLVEGGGTVMQATRLYDPVKHETRAMRTKEDANDYRYFPDPDLLTVQVTEAQIETIRSSLPELPEKRRERFISDYQLPEYDARVLTGSRDLADYFEQAVTAAGGTAQAKPVANWVMGDLLGALNKSEQDITDSPITPQQLGGLIQRIADNTISGKIAKTVFAEMLTGSGATADQIIADQGLKQETDSGAIEAIIRDVLAANEKMVEEYRSGKEKAFNGLVGQVMKASKGKANPAQVNELMKKMLS